MKIKRKQALGRTGEVMAAAFLEEKGYTILERNFRTPYGEIDLIVHKDNLICFIEVKTRANSSLGPPEISITTRKQEHMRSAAEFYMQEYPERANDWRIDAITIQLNSDNFSPLIDHFENVIT